MVTSFVLAPAGPQLDGATLAAGPAPRTTVEWKGDVTISGKLAAFGPQGLLDRIARKNIDTFIDGIRSGLS